MNTQQIERALKHNPKTVKRFCGVFPSDRLPKSLSTFPCGFVANTDPSTEPGTHWVVFHFPNPKTCEFFDSYGQKPEHYSESFKTYLKPFEQERNVRKLQSSWTEVCGHYCIFYLYQRACGHSLNNIVNMFGNNTLSNDRKVSCYVKKYFDITSKPFCGLNQCCKKLFRS